MSEIIQDSCYIQEDGMTHVYILLIGSKARKEAEHNHEFPKVCKDLLYKKNIFQHVYLIDSEYNHDHVPFVQEVLNMSSFLRHGNIYTNVIDDDVSSIMINVISSNITCEEIKTIVSSIVYINTKLLVYVQDTTGYLLHDTFVSLNENPRVYSHFPDCFYNTDLYAPDIDFDSKKIPYWDKSKDLVYFNGQLKAYKALYNLLKSSSDINFKITNTNFSTQYDHLLYNVKYRLHGSDHLPHIIKYLDSLNHYCSDPELSLLTMIDIKIKLIKSKL